MQTFQIPRVMLAAPASGSGKTMITCGLLRALANRGYKTIAYKCGPDYIDPMFHTQITGVPCRNADTFFASKEMIGYLLKESAEGMDIAVMEGVMGYYDGIAGCTMEASSYDLADKTDTPVILVVNARGMSLSAVPFIKGFLDYEQKKHIVGVLLNQVSPMIYPRLKEIIERDAHIRVLGYCPVLKEPFCGSRYLGLQMPEEIQDLQNKVDEIAHQLEETVDLDALIELAQSASAIAYRNMPVVSLEKKVRIAVAKDEAFCFYYRDNLDILEKMGAEPVYFSPIHDSSLPTQINGVLLGGGYPELFAERLSANHAMRESILNKLREGLPYLAECGGFLYLMDALQTAEGKELPMVGFFKGKAYPTGKLSRFGYVTLQAQEDNAFLREGEDIKAHEFHYFDTDNNGADFMARKPQSPRNWACMHADGQGVAGFPHLYYPSNLQFVRRFLRCCEEFAQSKHAYQFFCHKECEYFPCHKNIPEDAFNCLFCYCPLYGLQDKCGGNFTYLENGIKSCMNCTLPHSVKGYDYIMSKSREIMELGKKQEE